MVFSDDMSNRDIYEYQIYWADSANAWSPGLAWRVTFDGILDNYYSFAVSSAKGIGVRPVVRILKSNL